MTMETTFTQALFDDICERLADGESLRAVCRDTDMPDKRTFYRWMRAQDKEDGTAGPLRTQYTRAKCEGCSVMAEDVISIADDGTNDYMESNDPDNPGYKLNGEHTQRSKLRMDARKWYTSKIAPKIFGDRQALEVTGSVDIAQGIIAARKRVAKPVE